MALKFQTITFREKNPNRIPVHLFRGDTPLVPSDELALFLELRADPKGRLLAELALAQPLESSPDLLSEQLPDDLSPAIYYVGLRQEVAGGELTWSGVCFLQILPVGSLEKVSVQGLNLTLDESTQVLSVAVDETPFSLMAGTLTEQAQQVALDTLQVAGDRESVDDSKQHVDQVKGQIDGIKTNIDTQQVDVNQKAQQVAQNKNAVDTAKQSVDTTKSQIDSIKTNIDTQQNDVNQKAQQVATDKATTNSSAANALTSEGNAKTSENNAASSELNAANSATTALGALTSVQIGAPLGPWNVLTNSPALSADASAIGAGGYYNITVAGNSTFAGQNFLVGQAFAIGDRIAKIGNQWYRIPGVALPGPNTVDEPKLSIDLAAKITYLTSLLELLMPDEQSGSLQYVDQSGNSIFKLDSTGLSFINQVTQAQVAPLAYLLNDYFSAGLQLTDQEGNSIFKADSTGVSFIGQVPYTDFIALQNAIGNILSLYPGEYIICDDEGNYVERITAAGVRTSTFSGSSSSASLKPVPGNFAADYNQIIIYGQSLSVGGSFASSVDFYDTKTFAGGILTNYDPDIAGAADTYFGSGLIALPGTGSETQGKGLAKILKELIRDENHIAMADQGYTLVVNSAGAGGDSWGTLSNTGSDEYRRLLESVRRGKNFAIALGKTYNVPVLCYIQGENSADKADSVDTFYNKLDTLFTNLNTDIKAITGQTNDVQFINYQIASFPGNPPATVNVPLAQLKISLEKANVHFGCAMYQFEYSDALHGTSNTYRIMGAMMGVVAKRAVVDGVKMLPIKPLTWSTQVNTAGTSWVLNMKMNVPVKPLVFDTSVNTLYTTVPTNYGFSILNGSTEIISSVSISRGDTLVFVCNQNPTGLTLTYAINGRASGGNLRDSQGDTLKISCEGSNKRVDNWCPIFKQII